MTRLGGMWVEQTRCGVDTVVSPPNQFTPERLDRLVTATNALIRHDVDYDIGCALQMARFEQARNVQSVYYLLPFSPDYDLRAPTTAAEVAEIVSLGHRLGAHVDLAMPRDASVNFDFLLAACRTDHLALRQLFGDAVTRWVSFHAPPKDALWRDLYWFKSCHAPHWKGKYLSDSRGVFSEPPEDRLRRGDAVQVNLHPEWWFWDRAKADMWRKIEAAKP